MCVYNVNNEKIYAVIITISYTERTFIKVSKNLTKYKFENNFVRLLK